MVRSGSGIAHLRVVHTPFPNCRSLAYRFVMSVIWKITHGYDLIDIQDPLAQVVESVNEEFSNLASPGSLYLVELFPCRNYHPSMWGHIICSDKMISVCRLPDWMPGTNFKRTARRARENLMRSRDEPYEMVKEQMASR